MRLSIIHSFCFLVAVLLFFNSCGDDKVTNNNTTNPDCGSHHTVNYGPFLYNQHTNTYVENNVRTFQFSAIPLTTIDNICTHGKPIASGNASFNMGDTSRPFLVKVVVIVAVGFAGYSSTGTYTPVGQIGYEWDGSVDVGLQQHYGNGPGSIIDYRVEVSFRSIGTLSQDEAFLGLRVFQCGMTLNYDEYRASDMSNKVVEYAELPVNR